MTIISPHIAACEEAIALFSRPHSKSELRSIANLEELEQLWQIDKEAYGDVSLEFSEFSQWWQRYELGSRCLWIDGKIQASIGVYPLYQQQAIAFAEGIIPEADLIPVTVPECEASPQQYWYASGIVVRPDLRGWAGPLRSLLQLGLGCWLDSGHVAFPLTITALAEYDVGERLLTMFGFSKARDKSEMPDGCDLYSLKLDSLSHARTVFRQKVN